MNLYLIFVLNSVLSVGFERQKRDLIGWNRYSNTIRQIVQTRSVGVQEVRRSSAYLNQVQFYLLKGMIQKYLQSSKYSLEPSRQTTTKISSKWHMTK